MDEATHIHTCMGLCNRLFGCDFQELAHSGEKKRAEMSRTRLKESPASVLPSFDGCYYDEQIFLMSRRSFWRGSLPTLAKNVSRRERAPSFSNQTSSNGACGNGKL